MPKQSIELFKEILELSRIVHHSLCASPPVRQVKKSNSPKGEKKHYIYPENSLLISTPTMNSFNPRHVKIPPL
jgi:hypothetical protein